MRDGYRVHPDAIDAYAAQLERASERVNGIMSSLGYIEIPSGAFGLLPDSEGLRQAYQEHADADQQDCGDLADLLRDAADGLQETSRGYRTIELGTSVGFGGGRS